MRARGPAVPALAVALVFAGAARAQTPPPAPKPSAPSETPPKPGWTTEPFAIENEASDFRLALTGYVQADFRSYHDWTVVTPDLRADESGWQRARVGVEGRYHWFSFQVDVAAALDPDDELKDAWGEIRFARELRLRGGRMKVPVSPEWMSSPSKTDFLERSVIVQNMAPDRDWGAEANGELGRLVEYQAGVFAGDGSTSRVRAGTTYAGRLVFKPWRGVEVGGSTSWGDVEASPAGPDLDPDPKGFAASSQTEYRFFEPVFVDGRRRRWDVEAAVRRGPFGFRAEYLEQQEERQGQGPSLENLPDVRGRGYQLAATWLLTGERKSRTIEPKARLFHGPGAIELAVRYEDMRVDDVENEGFEGFGNRARNLRPAGFRAATGGVSWWPTAFVRLTGNVVVERYHDPLLAPETGREGNYVSLLGRVQVTLP
jgi:phosphate-selective porin